MAKVNFVLAIGFWSLVALAACSEIDELSGNSTSVDLCEAVVYNQLAMSVIGNDLSGLINGATSQLQIAVEEMKLASSNLKKVIPKGRFDPRVLKRCKHDRNETNEQIATLEAEIQTMQDDEDASAAGWQSEMEELQRQKQSFLNEIEDLENEIRSLEADFSHQRDDMLKLVNRFYKPVDCADIQLTGNNASGVYTVYPLRNNQRVQVYCDLETDGGFWTVFMQRQQQDQPVDFNKSWNHFKHGFGNFEGEFWMGNDLLHLLTTNHSSILRMDASSFDGEERFAHWGTFAVGNEISKYRLSIGDFEDKMSTMGDSFSVSDAASFTTFDHDNDDMREFNCAVGRSSGSMLGKGAWWYPADCGSTRPTAPLVNSNYWNSACYGNWDLKRTNIVSLNKFALKFRRVNYRVLANMEIAQPVSAC